jgi:hypothetical protein
VTLIEPGGFSTDWAGPSAKHSEPLPAYDDIRERTHRERAARNTSGPGDPKASAAAVLRIVDADEPPLRVFFGAAPLSIAKADYSSRLETWEKWDDVSQLAQG